MLQIICLNLAIGILFSSYNNVTTLGSLPPQAFVFIKLFFYLNVFNFVKSQNFPLIQKKKPL
jgi:hypothetical protein